MFWLICSSEKGSERRVSRKEKFPKNTPTPDMSPASRKFTNTSTRVLRGEELRDTRFFCQKTNSVLDSGDNWSLQSQEGVRSTSL